MKSRLYQINLTDGRKVFVNDYVPGEKGERQIDSAYNWRYGTQRPDTVEVLTVQELL